MFSITLKSIVNYGDLLTAFSELTILNLEKLQVINEIN